MKRLRMLVVVLALLAVASLTAQQSSTGAPRPRRIAVFGSSVANGTGDELRKEGYTGRLRELLAPAGWEVLNQSRGGDNTVTMAPRFAPVGEPNPNTKYLLPVHPSYVVLGLSLGNEGIANGKTKAEKDAIYTQFETGMRGFIDRSRQNNIVPIVSLCYTRNDFTAVEYEYTRRMNLVINSWDVPSVNFLGAVDDGEGKWAEGFWNDSLHPNSTGHTELTTTFVPSLFEALERGKPLPTKLTSTGFAHITSGASPLTFMPESTMHPFAVSLTVRTQSDGTVEAISGSALTATTQPADVPGRNGAPPTPRKMTTFATGAPFTASIGVQKGVWAYTASTGTTITSSVKADTAWHQVVLSHYTARGETLLYVDGKLAGKTAERLQPARFVFGGSGSASAGTKSIDLKDVMIYRSALNADEVATLQKGSLLQASLEVYAPLADTRFSREIPLENRAQSMTALKMDAGTIAHGDK